MHNIYDILLSVSIKQETLESSETFMTEASVGESTSSEQTEAQNEMVLRETQVLANLMEEQMCLSVSFLS